MSAIQVLVSGGVQAADELERRGDLPYLLYTDENIARLKERVKHELIMAEAWQRTLAGADAALESQQDAGGRERRGRGGLDSLSKVYLCATQKGTTLDVQMQGQPVINAYLRAPKKPAEVNLNGQHVDPIYDEKMQTIRLSLRGN